MEGWREDKTHTALHTVVGELEVLLHVRNVDYLTLCETGIVSGSCKGLGVGVGPDTFIGVRLSALARETGRNAPPAFPPLLPHEKATVSPPSAIP